MASKNLIPLDPEKFRAAMKKHGIGSYAEINAGCGYNSGAIEYAIKHQHMTKVMSTALRLKWEMTPDEYAPEEEPAPAPAPVPAQTEGIGTPQLYAAVKNAIFDAVRELSEAEIKSEAKIKSESKIELDTDKLYDCIARGVKDAINTAFKVNAKDLRGLIYTAVVNGIRMSLKKEMLHND